jgi:septal ring factor EnvC (AmiA/AmiB activator)
MRSLAAALIVAVGLSVRPGSQSPAEDAASRYRAMADRAKARLEALNKEAAALAARERSLLTDLRRLELGREAREAELARANAEQAAATADLELTRARIEVLERQLASERPAIEARVVRLYKQGTFDAPRWWLGVESIQDAARAQRVLSALARADRDRLSAYASQLDESRQARATVEARSREAATWQARAAEAREAAARAASAQAALVASIDRQRDLTARLAGELQQAQERLQASLDDFSVEEASASAAVLPIKSFQGALPWPVAGQLTARFGRAASSRFGTSIIRNGIEIAVAEGTPVHAVHEGRVAFADVFSGFGRLVIVNHGQGVFSLYGHLQSVEVARGARIDQRAVVGTAGRAPAGAPALYFEMRVDGRAVDPLQWLKRN